MCSALSQRLIVYLVCPLRKESFGEAGDLLKTTREEDKAYSLLGIFGVFTFLHYSEGKANAFRRLRKAIAEDSQELSQPQALTRSLRGRVTTCTPTT
ncbi:hypothetical protein J1614_005806 [Plenodomus biglobosus]|nr:hypothetical protein J1614_005806 [Plenodomus biglobosus]